MKKNRNKIITSGAPVYLNKCKPELFDLIITSPPYDNLRNYNGYNFPFEEIAKGCFKVLKQGGVIVWVVNDATVNGSETLTSFKQAIYFHELGLNLHDTMIFKKTNPIPQIYRKRYNNEFEYMFVFSKGKVKTHNPIKVPCLHAGLELSTTTYKNYSKNDQKRKKMANPVKKEKIKGNIWEYVVGKKKEDMESKFHPAPFPFQLAFDHIRSWTNPGDFVLDPMCGSGTTCLAAKALDRDFVGVDVSEEYCLQARKRISTTTFNKDLFDIV
jgi:site-specific DNA-methyltransferase (adenine-specific)